LKKIGIIVAVILILIGGTVSVLKWMEIGPFESAEGEVKEAPPPEPPQFVEMELLVIPVFDADRVAATFQIQFKLETVGNENVEKITKLLPRLNDAFLRDLYVFIPRLLRKQQTINVAVIKQRLQFIADSITGKGVVSNILIQSLSDIQQR